MTPDTLDRFLYVAPIVHSPKDMGILRHRMKVSKEYWEAATEYWAKVGESISGIKKIDKVYQDGLPDVSEKRVNIVVSQAQTPNYKILRQLKSQGALIIGTEDPAACMREFNLRQQIEYPEDEDAWAEAKMAYHNEQPELLEKRDEYIARRIKEDLLPGETGILFIGEGHSIADKLKGIQILEIEQLQQPLARALKALVEMNRTDYA